MHRRRGFTVPEMLAVIAIVVLILALLSPALNHARAVARRAVCSSNLHQVGVGMRTYQTNERALPAAFTHQWSPYSLRGVREPCAVWPAQVRLYQGGVGGEDIFYCPEAPASSRWTPKFGSSSPARYGYEEGELYVPGNPSDGNSYGHNNNGTRTHAASQSCVMGPKLLGMSDDPDPGGGHSFYISTFCVKRPSSFICFADSLLDGKWDAFVDYQVWGEDLSRRHFGTCNMLFADGHVLVLDDPLSWEDNAVCRCLEWEKGAAWNNDAVYP